MMAWYPQCMCFLPNTELIQGLLNMVPFKHFCYRDDTYQVSEDGQIEESKWWHPLSNNLIYFFSTNFLAIQLRFCLILLYMGRVKTSMLSLLSLMSVIQINLYLQRGCTLRCPKNFFCVLLWISYTVCIVRHKA
jgi:hypothetical protein